MWDRLNSGWKGAISFSGVVLLVIAFLMGVYYLDENGVRTSTDEVCYSWQEEKVPDGIKVPIEVEAWVEYNGDKIKTITRYVEFCDVKETRKEMRAEMKTIWKEMKQGCN